MIIGLSGYARSGKDTVGESLTTRYAFQRTAFADIMKRITEAIDPIVDITGTCIQARPIHLREVLGAIGWERAKALPEVRRFLQRLGTEAGRELLGQNVWVDYTLGTMVAGVDYVVTDVRFPNEAEAIARAGGALVRIERPGVGAPNDHPSEHALAGWQFDYILINGGSLEDLSLATDAMVTDLLTPAVA